jgi:hypothetical protein
MRFMLLICHDSSFTARTVKGDSAAWLQEMERRGVRKHGDRLRPAAEAKAVERARARTSGRLTDPQTGTSPPDSLKTLPNSISALPRLRLR